MENRRCVVGIRLNGHFFGSDGFQPILQEFHIECDLQFLSFNRGIKFYLTRAGLVGFGQQLNLPCLIRSGLKVKTHRIAAFAGNDASLFTGFEQVTRVKDCSGLVTFGENRLIIWEFPIDQF